MLLTALSLAIPTTAHAGDSADAILKASGINGGLILHIGCDDTSFAAAFRKDERFVVQCLTTSQDAAEQAREALLSQGLYGPVSVALFDGERLPYPDNLVNLIVVRSRMRKAHAEIERILAPGGTAVIRKEGNESWVSDLPGDVPGLGVGFVGFQKARPSGSDDWSHYLHDSDGNAVSQDSAIAPPRHLRWVAEPDWPRSHEHTPTIPSMVSTEGRIYYFFDEGITGIRDPRLPERWFLHARDGYNGLLLWKLPLKDWGPKTWNNPAHWHIPMSAPRRLVAGKNHLYATLDYRGPVHRIDAATGKVLAVLDATDNTEEILLRDSMLILRRRKQIPDYHRKAGPWGVQVRDHADIVPGEMGDEQVLGVNAETGDVLWTVDEKRIVTLSLAASDAHVCYHTFDKLVCLKRQSGTRLWEKDNPCWPDYSGTSGTLVIHQDKVFYAADRGLFAWELTTGKQLWQGPRIARSGIRHPPDLFVANGLLWGGFTPQMPTGKIPKEHSPFAVAPMSGKAVQGMDPGTGTIKQSLEIENLVTDGHHVRCYRGRATERFLLWTKRGIEFVDIEEGKNHERCNWFRGECSYGVMPANGLLYVPPHPCICSLGVALNGFNALAGPNTSHAELSTQRKERLVRGRAYASAREPGSDSQAASAWPTYRADNARSGAAPSLLAPELIPDWRTEMGGTLSPLTCSDRQLFVAQVDAHTVHALDAGSGKTLWRFTTGARVDSPPTFYKGTVLFGSRDGWVYCLRASDGALAWKFMAAPAETMIMVKNQLESSWPVPGSILIQNDIAYFACGRSSFLDGGVTLYGLDSLTGEVKHKALLDGPWPDLEEDAGPTYASDGAKSDILVSDDKSIYLGFNQFSWELQRQPTPATSAAGARSVGFHLMPGAGFLDHSWFDRVYWLHGDKWLGRFFRSKLPRSGQILSFDATTTYALKGFPKQHFMSPSFTPGEGYLLQATPNSSQEKGSVRRGDTTPARTWSVASRTRAKGMVLAGNTIFLAGFPDLIPKDDPYAALEGRRGAILQAVSAEDGSTIKEYPLDDAPVFDGMITANNRLFLALRNGTLVCFREK